MSSRAGRRYLGRIGKTNRRGSISRRDGGAMSGPARSLPYRLRVPLRKLLERKQAPAEPVMMAGLGHGEQLETTAATPDYVRLALTSRVYDILG